MHVHSFECVWIWKGAKEKKMRSFKRYVNEAVMRNVIMLFLHAKAAHSI